MIVIDKQGGKYTPRTVETVTVTGVSGLVLN
jgi:hypothetical protein